MRLWAPNSSVVSCDSAFRISLIESIKQKKAQCVSRSAKITGVITLFEAFLPERKGATFVNRS